MILDKDGLVIMEKGSFPGTVGDSCAETSRLCVLQHVLGEETDADLSLFVTDKGVLRYPTSPWREDDTSGDQVSPLLAALCLGGKELLIGQVISGIISSKFETGNGDLISPGLYAQLRRCQGSWLRRVWDWALVGQALIFKLPWRWSDSAKAIVPSVDSSGDYLNFINSLAFAKLRGNTFACTVAKKIVSQSKALSEVQSYYASEPNSQWLTDLYAQAIPKIWRNN